MTLVNSIDKIVSWLTENVCSKITLKLPDDYRNDTGYDVVMVNPAAFPLYVPGKDRLPPNVAAPIPSVCVQLMEGSDELIQKKRQLQIRLCLACWNPGQHGGDFQPSRKREGNRRLLLLRQYRRSCQNILAKHGRLARLLQSGRPRTPRDRNCGIYRRP